MAQQHGGRRQRREDRCRAQQQWEACEGQAVRAVQWMRAATSEEVSIMPRSEDDKHGEGGREDGQHEAAATPQREGEEEREQTDAAQQSTAAGL